MKRALLCVILLLGIGLAVSARAEASTTLLVYMCGTDLEDAGCMDLVEMAEVEAGEAINVVVLAGGAKEWDLEDLKGNSRTLVNTLNKDWKIAITVEDASICQNAEPNTWKCCIILRMIINTTVPMVLNTTCTKPVLLESLWDSPTKQ